MLSKISCWVALSALLIIAPLQADVPREIDPAGAAIKHDQIKFSVLIDHISAAAKSGDWQQAGWSDSAIDSAINEWAHQAALLTGQARPDLPARLAGLNIGQANGCRFAQAFYIASGNVSLSFVDKSVILVDGNAKISFAFDCIVVARGAVEISHGDRNVVMAGHFIHVSHDGNHKPGEMQGSLLMSGAVLNISHASGSVCAAPQMVQIGHSRGVTFADSPNVDAGMSKEAANKHLVGLDIIAAPPRAENSLEGKLKIIQTVKANDAGVGAMAVVNYNGAQLPVRLGERINDANGKAIAGMERWRLSFVAEDYALFSTDRADSGFSVIKK